MIETSELFTRANHLPRSQVLHNTRIRIEGDTTFKSLVSLLIDIRFKLNEAVKNI